MPATVAYAAAAAAAPAPTTRMDDPIHLRLIDASFTM
jgi:hypothetical protein